MSMLAEPRRKKGWILNPRKSHWAEDDSKFGQKMLEQMGWSKGKGLGREMGGITEHIRPSVQNDSRGLGYEGRTDDWVAHLDDFNDLLSNLQQDQKETDREEAAKADVKSLEERSKKSRARVHYHKFTRGKDLSRYSSQDLASILGGRSEGGAASQPVTPVSSRPPSPSPHADSEPTSEAETEPAREPTAEVDRSSGYTTINTGLSVKDYFAAKMRKMKMLKIKHEQEQQNASVDDELREETKEDAAVEPSDAVENVQQEEMRSKKKKKRKRPVSPTEEGSPPVTEQENVTYEEPKKKKKRPTSPVVEDLPSVPDEENDTSEEPRKKKKKKRKNADGSPGAGMNAASECPEMSPADVSPAEDKASVPEASEQAPSTETAEAPKKKKKKRRNTDGSPDVDTVAEEGSEMSPADASPAEDSIRPPETSEQTPADKTVEAPNNKRKKRKNACGSPDVDPNAAGGSPEASAIDGSPAEDKIPAPEASEQAPSDETAEAPKKKKKKRKNTADGSPVVDTVADESPEMSATNEDPAEGNSPAAPEASEQAHSDETAEAPNKKKKKRKKDKSKRSNASD